MDGHSKQATECKRVEEEKKQTKRDEQGKKAKKRRRRRRSNDTTKNVLVLVVVFVVPSIHPSMSVSQSNGVCQYANVNGWMDG